jgi:hypothetical protein
MPTKELFFSFVWCVEDRNKVSLKGEFIVCLFEERCA